MPSASCPNTYQRVAAQADGKRLVWVSRVGVLAWAIFMGVIMCIAQVCNLNVNWCAMRLPRGPGYLQ